MIHQSSKGLTLTELMLGTAIMAIVVIGIFSICNASMTLIDMAGTLTQMMNTASDRLELLYDVADVNFAALDGFNGQTFDLGAFAFNSIAVSAATGLYRVEPLSPDLKRVTVSVFYRIKGERVIGEDINLDGVLNPGEDINGDGRLTSPAEATTIIARKLP